MPNKETLDKFKDKPAILKHYTELNAIGVGSIANKIEDPNKVVELGSGLRMTQQQLLDIAAKRVAPVITNINESVSKTRQEDEIKRQQLIADKVKKHENKLQSEFNKYLGKIGKKKEKFNKEIDLKLANIGGQIERSDSAAAEFETTTRGEIETANKEFEERETKAVEQHDTDKENLQKNHEELLATKKQQLEDAKTGQETATQEIEELKEKKTELDDKNSELADKIEQLTAQLNGEIAKLDELKEQYKTHQDAIDLNLSKKEELDTNLTTVRKDLSNKREEHRALLAEVGVLSGAAAAYAVKLASLNTDKEDRAKRLNQAKETHTSWLQEKRELAEQTARDHERKRLEATEEYETRMHMEELERQRAKEERERQEQEEAEERERQEKKAAEEREIKEKEEAEEKARLEKEAAEEQARKEKEEAEEKARLEKEAAEEQARKDKEEADALEAKRKMLTTRFLKPLPKEKLINRNLKKKELKMNVFTTNVKQRSKKNKIDY